MPQPKSDKTDFWLRFSLFVILCESINKLCESNMITRLTLIVCRLIVFRNLIYTHKYLYGGGKIDGYY